MELVDAVLSGGLLLIALGLLFTAARWGGWASGAPLGGRRRAAHARRHPDSGL